MVQDWGWVAWEGRRLVPGLKARPRDAPEEPAPFIQTFLKIYNGPPSLGIVKRLIENTVKATRQHGPMLMATRVPRGTGVPPCPTVAQLACGGDAGLGSCLLGAAWPWVLPGQASVGRGEAPGKPPADVLPSAREGALSQNFG